MIIIVNAVRKCINTAGRCAKDNKGIGVVELILILVEKPNAKHRYVLCGN